MTFDFQVKKLLLKTAAAESVKLYYEHRDTLALIMLTTDWTRSTSKASSLSQSALNNSVPLPQPAVSNICPVPQATIQPKKKHKAENGPTTDLDLLAAQGCYFNGFLSTCSPAELISPPMLLIEGRWSYPKPPTIEPATPHVIKPDAVRTTK